MSQYRLPILLGLLGVAGVLMVSSPVHAQTDLTTDRPAIDVRGHIFRVCVKHVDAITERCLNHLQRETEVCVRLIRHLVASGHPGLAHELAEICKKHILRDARRCTHAIARLCRRCLHALGHHPHLSAVSDDLSGRLARHCREAIAKIHKQVERSCAAIEAALGDRATDG